MKHRLLFGPRRFHHIIGIDGFREHRPRHAGQFYDAPLQHRGHGRDGLGHDGSCHRRDLCRELNYTILSRYPRSMRDGTVRPCGAFSFATSITTKAHLGHSNVRNAGVWVSIFMAARQLGKLFSVLRRHENITRTMANRGEA